MKAVTLPSKLHSSTPKEVRELKRLKVGQNLELVSQGKQDDSVPAPSGRELFGIAKDANSEGYRDREDR